LPCELEIGGRATTLPTRSAERQIPCAVARRAARHGRTAELVAVRVCYTR
jgi:hypothetical protein